MLPATYKAIPYIVGTGACEGVYQSPEPPPER